MAKQIGDLARSALQTNSTKSQDATSRKTACPKSWVSALFRRFQARWGHRWTSVIDGIEELAVEEWSRGLADTTSEQIKRGLESTLDSPWPPTLPEFLIACRGERATQNEFGLNYVPEYHRSGARITDPTRLLSSTEREKRRKAAQRHIEKLHEIVGGTS